MQLVQEQKDNSRLNEVWLRIAAVMNDVSHQRRNNIRNTRYGH